MQMIVIKKVFSTICALMLFALIGCGPKKLMPIEYVKYVETEKSGLRKEHLVDKWAYKVQYKPSTYIFLNENKTVNVDQRKYEHRLRQLEEYCFFNVYVNNTELKTASPIRLVSKNIDDYNYLLNYYLANNKMNFKLVIGDKVVLPTIYMYENGYNLSPQDVFIVGFEFDVKQAIRNKEQITLQYDDKLLKSGPINFVFEYSDLADQPLLII
jgi:hypothetical protein